LNEFIFEIQSKIPRFSVIHYQDFQLRKRSPRPSLALANAVLSTCNDGIRDPERTSLFHLMKYLGESTFRCSTHALEAA
jgi:hypothetical protein